MLNEGFSVKIIGSEVFIDSRIKMNDFDNFYSEDNFVVFIIEGVVLNKNKLINQYAQHNFQKLISYLYLNIKENFISLLEGEFRGVIYDKELSKIIVFTNPTSTQKVFYTKIGKDYFVDTDLLRLRNNLHSNKYSISPDITAMYQLLTFGNTLESKTPISDVFKLLDGCFLKIDLKESKINIVNYFDLESVPYYSSSKKSALSYLDEVFAESVKIEYDKDIEYGSESFALLSGGLDSRTALLYASRVNRSPKRVLCFSHKGYFDEIVSRKIAKDYNISYEHIALNDGIFLNDIDNLTRISGGNVLYTGPIHVQYSFRHINIDGVKIVHSGQIGDGILGGFNLVPYRRMPTGEKITINPIFLYKIKSNIERIMKNYEREELFLLRNIGFNRTVFGAQVIQQYAYQTSPFMTKDLMQLSVSLPEIWKYNQKFYLEWLNRHCIECSNYIWEKTLLRPNAYWKKLFGDHVLKRFMNIYYNKLQGKEYKISMSPEHYYYKTVNDVKLYHSNYFTDNISRLANYKELQNDVEILFKNRSFYKKSLSVNILAVFKLFFDE